MLLCCDAPAALPVPMSRHALRTDELDFSLPPELIATRPAEPRDSARMMVLSRRDENIRHACVGDLPEYLQPADALVFNTTAVAPARLRGRRRATGGRVEGLFLEELGPGRWLTMLTSGGRLSPGEQIELDPADRRGGGHRLELVEPHPEGWIVRPLGSETTASILDEVGRTPLPPYILKARDGVEVPDALDRRWYQTVYADPRQRRSVAAPTAGLHFTPRLLASLQDAGVRRIDVTLHVGPGTFRPITAETIEQHVMHPEQYCVGTEAVAALREVAEGARGRVVAVGSTAVRTLESLPQPLPRPQALAGPLSGRTDLLIAPPYRFRLVHAMLTNFHLPRSTLLALVAAMVGLPRVRAAYGEAIRHRYRFYSYGDAMLILP
ncbi:MAG: tRNA preQ1(34) S-adenosylmethionine ribosyltransferase-isomerase QueA [Planctomycetota bacterium]|jgi:S-adenosylmethionine:tRNA ribosyltransferase-isomerase